MNKIVRSRKVDALSELTSEFMQAGVRVGQVIHVPTMIASCPNGPPEIVRQLFQEGFDFPTAYAGMEETIPGFLLAVQTLWKSNVGGGANAYNQYVAELCRFVAKNNGGEYLVRVDWQIAKFFARGECFPLGQSVQTWANFDSRWFGGLTVAACANRGLRFALRQRRSDWNNAPKEKP